MSDKTSEDLLESREAFVKRLDGTYDKYEAIVQLRDDVEKIRESVAKLQNSGLRYDTILILLGHHTKLPKKTIHAVLEGLEELPEKYFEA